MRGPRLSWNGPPRVGRDVSALPARGVHEKPNWSPLIVGRVPPAMPTVNRKFSFERIPIAASRPEIQAQRSKAPMTLPASAQDSRVVSPQNTCGPQLGVDSLRDLCVLDDGRVHGCKAGPGVSVTRAGAERAGSWIRKRRRIDPGNAAAAEGVRHSGGRVANLICALHALPGADCARGREHRKRASRYGMTASCSAPNHSPTA